MNETLRDHLLNFPVVGRLFTEHSRNRARADCYNKRARLIITGNAVLDRYQDAIDEQELETWPEKREHLAASLQENINDLIKQATRKIVSPEELTFLYEALQEPEAAIRPVLWIDLGKLGPQDLLREMLENPPLAPAIVFVQNAPEGIHILSHPNRHLYQAIHQNSKKLHWSIFESKEKQSI